MAVGDLKFSEPLGLVLAGVLAGLVVHQTGEAGGTGTSKVAPESTAERPTRARPPTTSAPKPPAGAPAPAPSGGSCSSGSAVVQALVSDGYPRPERVEWVTTVIALVPDPATSGAPAEFDQAVDAIQLAAQSQSFTVERYWLPWQRADQTGPERPEMDRAGWLVFRQDLPSGRARMLVVALVGERLGTGIRRPMLEDALAIQAQIDPFASWLILGPYYSGTAASLRDGLEAWCAGEGRDCTGRSATLVTGTATRPSNRQILESTKGLKVTVRATVNPDAALSAAMHEFLRSALAIPDGRIGELNETSTAFGVAHANNTRTDEEASTPPPPGSHAAPASAEPSTGGVPFRISLPPHLPDLRVRPDGQMPKQLAFRDDELSIDKVPAQTIAALYGAREMTATTLDALRRQGITDVGILVTGTTDKISLVTALRNAAPDVRAHVYEANQVLADPEQHRALDGTLTASSYPVLASTQVWTGRPDVQPFASDSAEGIYNAFLALLWKGAVIDTARLAESLRDYRTPFNAAAAIGPPVWISVVIGGQIWPLAAYARRPEDPGWNVLGRPDACKTTPCSQANAAEGQLAQAVAASPSRPRLDRGRLPLILVAALLVLVLGNLASLLRDAAPMRRCPFLLLYDPETTPEQSPERSLFWLPPLCDAIRRPAILLGFWVLSLVGIAAGVLYQFPWILGASDFQSGDLLALVLIASSILLLVSPLRAKPPGPVKEVGWQRWLHPGHPVRWLIHLVLMVGLAIGVVVQVVTFAHGRAQGDGRAFLFFARLMNPSLGLTPAPATLVMATGMYLSCLFRLRVVRRSQRLNDAAERWKGVPVTSIPERLHIFARCAERSLGRILWVGAGLGVGLFFWDGVCPRSLDGRAFDFVVAVGFGLMFAVALAAALRADRLWRVLAGHLRTLAVQPWQAAFSTLPAHISAVFRTPMPGRLRPEDVNVACEAAGKLLEPHLAPSDLTLPELVATLATQWGKPDVRPPALAQPGDPKPPLDVQLRGHIVALRMAEVLSQMCDATRTTLFIGSVAAVSAVLASALYPFQPSVTLTWGTWAAVGATVLVALRVIGGIERDEVLSRIAGTTPGAMTFTWPLVLRILGYVIVPLGSLAATYLPDHGGVARLLLAVGGSLPKS